MLLRHKGLRESLDDATAKVQKLMGNGKIRHTISLTKVIASKLFTEFWNCTSIQYSFPYGSLQRFNLANFHQRIT